MAQDVRYLLSTLVYLNDLLDTLKFKKKNGGQQSEDMIDVPDIQISDEMKGTDDIACTLIAMMADKEQLVLGNIAGGEHGDTEENVEVLSLDMALSSTLKIEIDVKIYDPFFPV